MPLDNSIVMTRRAACGVIGRTLLVGGAALRGVPARAAPASLGAIGFQLSWLETAQFAGSYIAQSRGYYQARGLNVEIVPGGPNVAVPPLIVAGKAFVGLSSVSDIAQARANGAPLKIVAAGLQKNPGVILSPAAKPIKTPRDLIGKRFGVASADLVDVQAFMQINHLAAGSVQIVPVQFDPSPLVVGEVDAFFAYATDQAVTLAVRGFPVYSLRFDDFGDSGLYQVYAAHERSLADAPARAKLTAFLAAERLGWNDALRDPDFGARLAVERYGANLGLSLKQQQLQSRANDALIASDDTRRHGLLWMSDAKMARAIAVLATSGIPSNAHDLFDRSVLESLPAG